MDESQKDLMIEQAKNLALTISLFNTKYDKLLSEFNSKLTKVHLQLSNDVNQSNESLNFIKENVAYQSNLESTKNELETFITIVNENFDNYSKVHQHPYALETHNHNQYSDSSHVHDYVNNSVYNNQIQLYTEKSNLLDTYNDNLFKIITQTIEEKYLFLLESIVDTNKELDELSETLATGIDDVGHRLDVFKSNIKKDIKDLLEIIDVVKNNLAKQLDKTFSKLSKDIDDSIDKIYSKIDKNEDKLLSEIDNLEVDLSEKIDNKSNKDHNHDGRYLLIDTNFDDRYSKLDHTHPDILTSIDVLQEKNLTLESSINNVLEELKDKPEYSEILLKSDLIKLKHEIINGIPLAQNGKDAEEWEFKPHPKEIGILIFKKQSDKNWNYINFNLLMPKQKNQELQQLGGFGGGGGSSGITFLFNNNIVSHSAILNFVGTAVTSVTEFDGTTTVVLTAGLSTVSTFATYEKLLSGFIVIIQNTEHKIANISNILVKNSTGKLISVADSISINRTITIESNIDLNGCVAMISGTT